LPLAVAEAREKFDSYALLFEHLDSAAILPDQFGERAK
jgi:hypothetical protein